MNISDFKDIIYNKNDKGLVELTINQVKRKNALSNVSFLELWWAMEIFDKDDSAFAMIITGADNPELDDPSEQAFSSGGYFSPAAFSSLPPELADQIDMSDIAQAKLTLRMAQVSKPIIGALNGYAIGGAFTMLLSGADLIYMSDAAYIRMPFVKIAIIPEFASTYILPRLLGMQKTKEIFYFGKKIDAQEAEALKIINGSYPHAQLMDEVRRLALELAPPHGASVAIFGTKKALNTPLIEYYEKALALENEGLNKCVQTKDFFEGMLARKEKRDVNYTGK